MHTRNAVPPMPAAERELIDKRILAAPENGRALSYRDLAEHLLHFVKDTDAKYLADEIYDPPADEEE